MCLLHATYGTLLVALVLSAMLYGFTTLQTFVYYKTYPRDWIGYKLGVYWLSALDTLHIILTAHLVYFYLVSNFGEKANLVVWSFKLQTAIGMIIIMSVHGLYWARLRRLNGAMVNKNILFFVTAAVACSFGVGIASCYFIYRIHEVSQVPSLDWLMFMSMGSFTIVDWVIAATFSWMLWSNRTGFDRTDSLIYTVVMYTLGSGLLTSICSIVCIAVCAALPESQISWSVNFLTSKLYINSYLSALNVRIMFANEARSAASLEHPSHPQRPSSSSFSKLPSWASRSPDKMLSFATSNDTEAGIQRTEIPIAISLDSNKPKPIPIPIEVTMQVERQTMVV